MPAPRSLPAVLLFKIFYYYQGFLPLWITGAIVWWFCQLAYRRRQGLLTGPQLNRSMSLFSLSVLTSPLLGPLPFYLFLFSWLYRQPGREHPVLRRFNLALATLLVTSCLAHSWLDWQRPLERQVGRILDSQYLDGMMLDHRLSCSQLIEWARYRDGRLQSNAVYMLRYCKDSAAAATLQEIQAQGPPLSALATQSLTHR